MGDPADVDSEIKKITTKCEISFATYNKTGIVSVFSPTEFSDAIRETLDRYNFSELHIPELTGDPLKLLAGFNNRKADIQLELESLENEISDLQSTYFDFVLGGAGFALWVR